MTVHTERRDIPRKRPVSLVYVELPPSNGGMMRDLSEVGFAVRAMLPMRLSEKTSFSMSLDDSTRIDGEAIVLWVEDGGRVAGLEFAGLAVHARESIRRWLAASPVDSVVPVAEAPEKADEPSTFDELRDELRDVKPRSVSETKPVAPIVETKPVAEQVPPAVPPFPERRKSAFTLPPAAMLLPGEMVVPSKPADPPSANGPEAKMPDPKGNGGPPPPLSPVALALPAFAPFVDAEPVLTQEPPLPPSSPASPPAAATAAPTPVIPRRKISTLASLGLDGSDEPKTVVTAQPAISDSPAAAPLTSLASSTPPLEPLSSFEGESGVAASGWMERFTLSRAITIMLWLVVIVGTIVYHRELGVGLIWLGQQLSDQPHESAPANSPSPNASTSPDSSSRTPESPAEAPLPPPAVPPSDLPQSSAVPTQQSGSATQVPNSTNETQSSGKSSEPSSAALPKAAEKPPSPQTRSSGPSSLVPLKQTDRAAKTPPPAETPESGQSEFQQAQEILRDPNRVADTTQAVRLLWNAVEKGNVNAELALANLYRTGHGVTRSCAQARILLSTAAHKGSAEAQKRLDALQNETCED
jgi:hypothetical protein